VRHFGNGIGLRKGDLKRESRTTMAMELLVLADHDPAVTGIFPWTPRAHRSPPGFEDINGSTAQKVGKMEGRGEYLELFGLSWSAFGLMTSAL
jgi:hypothetical protein